MKTILLTFGVICIIIYLLSVIEIIGSYILTRKIHGVKIHQDTIIFPIIIPIFAPWWCLGIISEAQEAYKKGIVDDYYPQESLFEYLRHNCMGYEEWYRHNNVKIVPFKSKNKK